MATSWTIRHSDILSRKNNEVWYTVKRASKSGFSMQKGKFNFIGAYMPNQPYNWVG